MMSNVELTSKLRSEGFIFHNLCYVFGINKGSIYIEFIYNTRLDRFYVSFNRTLIKLESENDFFETFKEFNK